jgi:hypothetical protein
MEEEFEADTAGEDQVNAMFVELRSDMPLLQLSLGDARKVLRSVATSFAREP